MLMLQLRFPTRIWCISLKVISHWSVQQCNIQCNSLTCDKCVSSQTTITGPSRLMQRQLCRVIQRDWPSLACPLQSRRWMQPSTCKQPEKHWFLWKTSITGWFSSLLGSCQKVIIKCQFGVTNFILFYLNKNSYDEVRNRMDRGYPRLIRWDFQRVGSRVDAVFENYGEDVFIFGHRHFWEHVAFVNSLHVSFLQAICISLLDPDRASTAFHLGEWYVCC